MTTAEESETMLRVGQSTMPSMQLRVGHSIISNYQIVFLPNAAIHEFQLLSTLTRTNSSSSPLAPTTLMSRFQAPALTSKSKTDSNAVQEDSSRSTVSESSSLYPSIIQVPVLSIRSRAASEFPQLDSALLELNCRDFLASPRQCDHSLLLAQQDFSLFFTSKVQLWTTNMMSQFQQDFVFPLFSAAQQAETKAIQTLKVIQNNVKAGLSQFKFKFDLLNQTFQPVAIELFTSTPAAICVQPD